MSKRINSLKKDIERYLSAKVKLVSERHEIEAVIAATDAKIAATRELIKQLGGDESSDGLARPSAQPMSR